MLHKLIDGRILFTPMLERGAYTFTFTGSLERFFSGLVFACPS